MLGLSRFVLGHRRAVALFWLAVLLSGGVAAAGLSSRLSGEFALPGAASWRANQQILREYGTGGNGYPEVVAVTLPAGSAADTPGGQAALGTAFVAVARTGLRVAGYANTGDRAFLTTDPCTSYGLVFAPFAGELEPPNIGPQITSTMTAALPAGSQVQVTGMNELLSGGQAQRGFGVLAETLLAGAAALVVLVLVFGSALAVVPLLIATVAILACFLALFALAEVGTVSVIVQYLAALIGLGVAIDYSLLLVTRWREELASGRRGDDAVTRAMATAGRAVLYSGTTVAIGLLSLIVLPVPALRSIGIGGMLVPGISVAVTLTLLPVLLATVGERMDWPHRHRPATGSRAWRGWARLVTRHRWTAALAALVTLGALGAAALGITIGEPAARALGGATPAAPPSTCSTEPASPPASSTPSTSSPRPAPTPPPSPRSYGPCPACTPRSPPPDPAGAATEPHW